MRRVVVNEFLTLDGTAQAPGGPDEGTSSGFRHGGWHMRFGTEDGMERLIGEAGGFLLPGARTSSSPATGRPQTQCRSLPTP